MCTNTVLICDSVHAKHNHCLHQHIYIYIHTHKFNLGMHQNIIAVFIWTHIMLNHYHQLHTHQTQSLSSIACIQARLSTPFGSKPYSRLSEPVFSLCRLGSFIGFFHWWHGILNSNRHMWKWKEEAMLCEYTRATSNLTHFWQDFSTNCTRPVSVHLAMAIGMCWLLV